jgi:hypothetical protein
MDSIISDTRRKPDGTPLRLAEKLIQLQMREPEPNQTEQESDYIYEAQLSLMVTGVDDWVWNSYCFVDGYF